MNATTILISAALVAITLSAPSSAQEGNELNLDGLDKAMRRGAPERISCPKHERIWVGEKAGRDLPVGSDSLVDILYWELAAKAVTDTGECSCENWRPSWEAAVAWFERDFAGIDGQALRDAQNASLKRKAPLMVEARRLCREQGVR